MAGHNILGAAGEYAAMQYLTLKGYRIRDTNWRYHHLELDIVAENDDYIVFVEVKTTVTPKGSLANMPISSREWSMIDECERRKNEVYLIARVFDIDSSSPDIYFLEGHKAE